MSKKGEKMIIVHHNDADGRCAAAIAGRSPLGGKEATYIEADYAKAKDKQWLKELLAMAKDQVVLIVDFSLPLPVMEEINAIAARFIWIDHHASVKDYPQHFEGKRDFTNKGAAGCELAWEFFFPDKPTPYFVKLIGDYDTWRLMLEVFCKPLITALDAMQWAPAQIPQSLFTGIGRVPKEYTVDGLIEMGRTMIRYRDGYTKGCRNTFGFETEFHGLNCYALNMGRMGSMMFGDEMQTHAACLAFYFDGKLFTVSLYSEKPEVDCADICKQHGGGGHKGAAGFQCQELPFKFKERSA